MHTEPQRDRARLARRIVVPFLVVLIIAAITVAGLALHELEKRGERIEDLSRQLGAALENARTLREQAEAFFEEVRSTAEAFAAEKARADDAEARARMKSQLASLYEDFFERALSEVSSGASDDEITTPKAILDNVADRKSVV